MEKPNNLICTINETFLCKQMPRLIKVFSRELLKKTSKLSKVCLLLKVTWPILIWVSETLNITFYKARFFSNVKCFWENLTMKLRSLTAVFSWHSKALTHLNRLYSAVASVFTLNALAEYSPIKKRLLILIILLITKYI